MAKAKYVRKDLGAWGDRLEEARMEKAGASAATRKRKLCVNCKTGRRCIETDRRVCYNAVH
jgi:hypothetical protein